MKSLSCMPCFSVANLGVPFARIITPLYPILFVVVDVDEKLSCQGGRRRPRFPGDEMKIFQNGRIRKMQCHLCPISPGLNTIPEYQSCNIDIFRSSGSPFWNSIYFLLRRMSVWTRRTNSADEGEGCEKVCRSVRVLSVWDALVGCCQPRVSRCWTGKSKAPYHS